MATSKKATVQATDLVLKNNIFDDDKQTKNESQTYAYDKAGNIIDELGNIILAAGDDPSIVLSDEKFSNLVVFLKENEQLDLGAGGRPVVIESNIKPDKGYDDSNIGGAAYDADGNIVGDSDLDVLGAGSLTVSDLVIGFDNLADEIGSGYNDDGTIGGPAYDSDGNIIDSNTGFVPPPPVTPGLGNSIAIDPSDPIFQGNTTVTTDAVIADNAYQYQFSAPLHIFDVDEVDIVESRFVYNFFTFDESGPISQQLALQYIPDSSTTIQEQLRSNPRFIQIDFNCDGILEGLPQNLNTTTVFDNITYENASSNLYYAGFDLYDASHDIRLARVLETSGQLQDISQQDSISEMISQLTDLVTNNSFGQTFKTTFQSVFQNLQPQTFVSNRGTIDTVNNITHDPVGVKIYSSLFADTIKQSAMIGNPLLFDEYDQLIAPAETIQSNKRIEYRWTNPLYDFIIEPYEVDELGIQYVQDYAPDVFLVDRPDTPEDPKVAGFIVEKFVLDREAGLETAAQEPQFIEATGNLGFFIDNDVMFGKVYRYKIKTVVKMESFGVIRDFDDEVIRLVKGKFLVASEGVITQPIATISTEPPEPPHKIYFDYTRRDAGLSLMWEFPFAPTLSVAKFHVLRRESITESFELIKVLDFSNGYQSMSREQIPDNLIAYSKFPILNYFDDDFNESSKYIYAICSVDYHGLVSNYSPQFQVHFNSFENKLMIKIISKNFAPRQFPNMYLNEDTFKDTIKVSAKNRLNIVFDPEYYQLLATNSQKNQVDGRLLNLIASNYKLQLMNVDVQNQEVININIRNLASSPNAISAYSTLNPANLTFSIRQ